MNNLLSNSNKLVKNNFNLIKRSIWTPNSKRVGLIGRKKGMTAIWDELGNRVPVTLIHIDDCQVTQVKSPTSTSPFAAVQLGSTNSSRASKPLLGHFEKANVNPKRHIKEFKCTSDAIVPIGTKLSVGHFVPGQYVDIKGTSNGKGFAGVMKRWNFKGLRASHGVSISHRSQGSTGQNQDPGRVFPGKKMAGRLGGETVTIQNVKVMRIDLDSNTLLVKGSIPGRDDGYLYISDAIKKMVIDGKNKGNKLNLNESNYFKALPWGVNDLPFPYVEGKMTSDWPKIIQAPSKPKFDKE